MTKTKLTESIDKLVQYLIDSPYRDPDLSILIIEVLSARTQATPLEFTALINGEDCRMIAHIDHHDKGNGRYIALERKGGSYSTHWQDTRGHLHYGHCDLAREQALLDIAERARLITRRNEI